MGMARVLLVLLVLVAASASPFCLGMGDMNSYGALWGSYSNHITADSNTNAVCILQAGTLTPRCSGTYPNLNDTNAPANTTLLAMGSGAYFSCGLTYRYRNVICWGDPVAAAVPAALRAVNYSSISVGGFHACGLRSNGQVDCWGQDLHGETRPPANQSFVYIAAGWQFTCALIRDEGRAFCWGGRAIQAPSTQFQAVFSGSSHACGLEKITGKAFCWGSDAYNKTRAPTDRAFHSLALGVYHTCGISKGTLEVLCWGDNTFSQVQATPNEPFASIVAGDYYTCGIGLKKLQQVKCWGNSISQKGAAFESRVSQGVCVSGGCGNHQYQLSSTTTSCPAAGDRICLPCEAGCIIRKVSACSCSTNSTEDSTSQRILSKRAIAGLIVGLLAAAALLLSASYCVLQNCKNSKRKRETRLQNLPSWHDLSVRFVVFSSSQLRAATHNFSTDTILGRGAHGVVYRGELADGQVVAIKKETRPNREQETFSQELELLARINHRFLVKLVGYCEKDKLLVYEFIENGSLADCLFRKSGLTLNLATRIRIAAQAARALEYLHVYASPRIIHRDVKSANILLDKHWNARVSDFGLSLLGPQVPEATHLSGITVMGTPGYLDPEYWQTMQLNTKSDVYSFGVVLLELLTGRTAFHSQRSIVAWVTELVEAEEGFPLSSICDQRLQLESDEEEALFSRVLGLALDCTQAKAKGRPTMSIAAASLEAVSSLLQDNPQSMNTGGLSSSNDGVLLTSSSSSNFGTASLEVSSTLLR